MKSAARRIDFDEQQWGRENGGNVLTLVEAPERFRARDVSTLSVTFARDGSISHRVNVLPEHRAPVAAWLMHLAARVGGAD